MTTITTINAVELAAAEAKCHEFKQLQRLVEQANAQMDAIRDELKAAMTAPGELQVGTFKILWTPYATLALDAKKLKSDHPDLYNVYCVEKATSRFTIA